jgi:general secretion pathway protein F
MALFKYSALSGKGKKIQGVINADSLLEAQKHLSFQNVLVTSLFAYTRHRKIHLKREQTLEFIRDLSQLVGASLTLYDSLKAIADKTEDEKSSAIFADLCDRVRQGEKFSFALKQYPKTFSQVLVAIIEAGEESGSLAAAFRELASMMQQEDKLRKNLSSAMVYPVFLSVFCLVVVMGLFIFLIPSMKDLFEGRPIPPFTAAVLNVSSWITSNLAFLITALSCCFFCIFSYFKWGKGKQHWQLVELKLPIIARLKKASAIVKFSRTFSILLASGTPVVKALEMSSRVMNQIKLEEIMNDATIELVRGKKLSEVLQKAPLIPPMVVKMIATAEQTAKLSEMLFSIADIYQANLEKDLQQFTSLIQPVMILLLGLIVGLILISVLLPMTDISSFIN